ncbi:hypothetical protein EfmJHP35_17050 [Enterococcus faecium]|nr:hypothetical protein EfmJHP35_17050 [Enterococcus faecium]
MTQVHFTFESEEIQAIINESGANDTAKTLMTIMFNQLMEEQRNQYIQANAYERSEERQSQRNGYYDRSFTTRIGTLELHVPRTRDGKFSPTIFERYQRSEKALIAAMIEMVISGVSTRKVTKTVELLTDGATVSKSWIKMNIRKLIAGVVCLAAASGFLTGCGSASSTADKEEKVTVWAWDETFNIKVSALILMDDVRFLVLMFKTANRKIIGIPFFNRSFNEVCSV